MNWSYGCGHTSTGVIMDNSILSLSAYFTWKDGVGLDGDKSKCWSCWCEEHNKKLKELKK